MLIIGGCANLLVAAGHLVIPFFVQPIGPLSAPAWAQSGTGRFLMYLAAAGVAVLATLAGLYGLSGAGRIRRLPFLRTALVFIGAVFLADLVDMGYKAYRQGGWEVLARPSVAPFVLLSMGLFYLVGAIGLWRELRPPSGPEEASART